MTLTMTGTKDVQVGSGGKKAKSDTAAAAGPFELDDNEKFMDFDGEVVDVDVRGERTWDKMFFKCKDIEQLLDNEIDEASYEKGMHLVSLDVREGRSGRRKQSIIEPVSFVTYMGLLKMMFYTGNSVALRFQRWAAKKLFVIHFGGTEDKVELAAELLGVPVTMLKTCINANFNSNHMSKLRDLEAQLTHEMHINQQMKTSMEVQLNHKNEIMNMMQKLIQEKDAMIDEKNKRIAEMNETIQMYRDLTLKGQVQGDDA